MWSEKNVAVLTEEGAFALFFRPHPGGIWQVKRPHRREFAIQAEKNASARGSAGGEVVGLGTAGKTDALTDGHLGFEKLWWTVRLFRRWTLTILYDLMGKWRL